MDVVSDNRAVVKPYPFDVDPLVIGYTARLVPKRAYKDGSDFLSEFYRAERISINRTLASA
jgi:hypothetical protein